MGRGSAPQVSSPAPLRRGALHPSEGVTWAARPEADPITSITYPTRTMLIVGGLPGIGKSHLLKRLNPDAEIVGPDQVGQDIKDQLDAAGLEGRPRNVAVYRETNRRIAAALKSGRPVILDAPAVLPHLLNGYRATAEHSSAQLHAIYLDGDMELALAGQHARGRMINNDWIERYAEGWSDMRENFEALGTEMSDYQSVVIFDRESADRLEALTFE